MKWLHKKSNLELKDQNEISDVDSSDKDTYFYIAVLATVITVAALLVLFAVRKYIKLVVQLFEEAAKALMCMTLLIFEPILVRLLILVPVICTMFLPNVGVIKRVFTFLLTF